MIVVIIMVMNVVMVMVKMMLLMAILPGSRSRQGSPSYVNLDLRTTCTSSENCIKLSKTNTFVHNSKKNTFVQANFFKVKDMMRIQCNVKFLLDRSDPVLAQPEHLHRQLGRLQHLD